MPSQNLTSVTLFHDFISEHYAIIVLLQYYYSIITVLLQYYPVILYVLLYPVTFFLYSVIPLLYFWYFTSHYFCGMLYYNVCVYTLTDQLLLTLIQPTMVYLKYFGPCLYSSDFVELTGVFCPQV